MNNLNKYVIKVNVVVVAKNSVKAKEYLLAQLARTGNDTHSLADSLVENYDEDTKIVDVIDGIWKADKN